jgi:hypothetical protein
MFWDTNNYEYGKSQTACFQPSFMPDLLTSWLYLFGPYGI